jgi:hypothetical protein
MAAGKDDREALGEHRFARPKRTDHEHIGHPAAAVAQAFRTEASRTVQLNGQIHSRGRLPRSARYKGQWAAVRLCL